jgi:hypothetical protein
MCGAHAGDRQIAHNRPADYGAWQILPLLKVVGHQPFEVAGIFCFVDFALEGTAFGAYDAP